MNEMVEHRREESIDVLLVEGDPDGARLTRDALEQVDSDDDLHVVEHDESAIDFLHQRGEYADAPRPNLVLLDLDLPGKSGHEVLEEVTSDSALCRIPVVVLAESESEADVVESYEHCSNAYLSKPTDAEEFVELLDSLETFWLRTAELPPKPD